MEMSFIFLDKSRKLFMLSRQGAYSLKYKVSTLGMNLGKIILPRTKKSLYKKNILIGSLAP